MGIGHAGRAEQGDRKVVGGLLEAKRRDEDLSVCAGAGQQGLEVPADTGVDRPVGERPTRPSRWRTARPSPPTPALGEVARFDGQGRREGRTGSGRRNPAGAPGPPAGAVVGPGILALGPCCYVTSNPGGSRVSDDTEEESASDVRHFRSGGLRGGQRRTFRCARSALHGPVGGVGRPRHGVRGGAEALPPGRRQALAGLPTTWLRVPALGYLIKGKALLRLADGDESPSTRAILLLPPGSPALRDRGLREHRVQSGTGSQDDDGAVQGRRPRRRLARPSPSSAPVGGRRRPPGQGPGPTGVLALRASVRGLAAVDNHGGSR